MPATKTNPKPKQTSKARILPNKPVAPRKPAATINSDAEESVVVEPGKSRRTIMINRDTEESIIALVGPRKFSAFAQTAFEHELQRQSIDPWLADQESAHGGPLSSEDVEFAEKAWQSRK